MGDKREKEEETEACAKYENSALSMVIRRPHVGSEHEDAWRSATMALLGGFISVEEAGSPYDEPGLLPNRALGSDGREILVDWNGDAWMLGQFARLVLHAERMRHTVGVREREPYLDAMLMYATPRLDTIMELVFWMCYENDMRCRDVVLRDNSITRFLHATGERPARALQVNLALGPLLNELCSGKISGRSFRQRMRMVYATGHDMVDTQETFDVCAEDFPLTSPENQHYGYSIRRVIALDAAALLEVPPPNDSFESLAHTFDAEIL